MAAQSLPSPSLPPALSVNTCPVFFYPSPQTLPNSFQLCSPTLWVSLPLFMENPCFHPISCFKFPSYTNSINRAKEGIGIIKANKIHQADASQVFSEACKSLLNPWGSSARDEQGCCLLGVFWPDLQGDATNESKEVTDAQLKSVSLMFSGGSWSWQQQVRLSGKCIPGPGRKQGGFPWQVQRVRPFPLGSRSTTPTRLELSVYFTWRTPYQLQEGWASVKWAPGKYFKNE